MHPALAIAVIAIVVAGEEIAVLVEGQLLGIAQTAREDFEIRPVGFHAKHRAFVGQINDVALFGFDVRAAIADAEVDAPVRAFDQAVEIVAGQAEVNAVAIGELLALVRFAVAVVVAQSPDARNVGEVNPAIARHHARGDAVEDVGETIGEHGRSLGHAVAVLIFKQSDGLRLDLHLGPVRARVLLDERAAVLDRARGEIVVVPRHVMPDVERARAIAAGLGDKDLAVIADVERDRVLELRFVGDEFDLEAGRDAELANRALGLGLGEVERDGCGRLLGRAEIRGVQNGSGQPKGSDVGEVTNESAELHARQR